MPASTRTIALLLIALGLLTLSSLPASGQDEDVRRPYLAGNGFLARGMDALAVEEYRKFLESNADHEDAPTARYGMGVALGRLGRHDEAIDVLDGLDRIRGFRFADESRIVAANAEFALGKYSDVATRLGSMIDRAEPPIVETAAPLLIESLYRNEDHQEAARAAERIVNRFSIATLGQRGALFAALSAERINDDDLVTEWAGWAIRNGNDTSLRPIAQLCLARTMLRNGDADGAIRISEQLTERGPESSRIDAMNILAEALRQSGRAGEADRVYASLQNLDQDNARSEDILIQRGVIAFEEGRHQEALRYFIQGNDGSENVARWAARCEDRLGRHDNAADRLAQIDDPSPSALYELAVELQHAQRLGDASGAFERFLRVSSTETEYSALRTHAAYALASIDHANHRYRQCAERCRSIVDDEATEDSTITASARLLLAESLYLDGDLEGAYVAFKECHDANPEGDQRQSIVYRLGMINAQLGNVQAADTILRSVLRGASTPHEYAPGLRTMGDLAIGRQDWTGAINAYTAFIAVTDASDYPTVMNLGIALARTEQFAESLESLDSAIDGDLGKAQLARAYFERGDVRHAIEDERGAVEDWTRAISLDQEGEIATTARLRLSSTEIARGNIQNAIKQLRSVVDSNAENAARAVATLDLGRLLLQSGKNDEAAGLLAEISIDDLPEERRGESMACLSIACARSGDDHGAASADERLAMSGADVVSSLVTPLLYERAWRFRRGGLDADAIGAYERLLGLSPGGDIAVNAAMELSDLLLNSGDPEAAISRLKSLIESGPEDDAAINNASLRLGTLYYNQGEYSGAMDALQNALDQSDSGERSLDQSRLICGESMHQLGLWASASTHFEIASMSDEPSIAEPALLRLGSSTAELQRWAASEAAFEQHLDRFPSSAHRQASHFGVGWARESSGDAQSAIGAYREAAQGQTETSARAQFQIGECLFALGKHEQAASELMKVDILYASPKWSAAALYEAGRCFDALGDSERASAQWRRVIETNGGSEWAGMARDRLGNAPQPSVAGETTSLNNSNSID